MTFREATAEDLDALFAMHRDFFEEEGYPHDDAAMRGALATLIVTPALGFVCVRDDAYLLVTFGYSIEFHGRTAMVDELYVVPAARGHCIGHEALELAERLCRERGVRALQLEVERVNERAKRLYHSTGFTDHDRHLLTKRLG